MSIENPIGHKSGTIIGYDPGGNGSHGIAKLIIENGKILEASAKPFRLPKKPCILFRVNHHLLVWAWIRGHVGAPVRVDGDQLIDGF